MSDESERGITAITVGGFKAIRKLAHIAIEPLTILAGTNSSGKSSIMQPLLLMKQTLEAPYDPGTFLLDGPNVHFTDIDQFLIHNFFNKFYTSNDNNIEEFTGFINEIYLANDTSLGIMYVKGDSLVFPWSVHYKAEDLEINLTITQSHEEILEQLGEDMDTLRNTMQQVSSGELKWRVVIDRCFLSVGLHQDNESIIEFGGVPLKKFPINKFKQQISQIIHVPGLRGNPRRQYNVASSDKLEFAGTFDNYVASLITLWMQKDPDKFEQLANALRRLGLTSHISAEPLNDAQIELRVGRTLNSDTKDMVSIADVGFGVSQVLPVLVAVLVAEPGQMVYIEQPELHLHPRAQVALAGVLADAANRGVRLVIETHSSLLLTGIQTLIAEGKLAPDKVMLHWFTRDENGITTIQSVQPDENGAYGDWPEDFDEVQLSADSAYLDAVEKRALEY